MNLVEPIRIEQLKFNSLVKLRSSCTNINAAEEGNFFEKEKVRDSESFHISFNYSDELVGGIRLTPVGHGITLTEELFKIDGFFSKEAVVLDANRLFLIPEHRGRGIHRYINNLCLWVLSNTPATYFTAVCESRLVGFYKSIGGMLSGKTTITLDDGTDRAYHFFILKILTVKTTIDRRLSYEKNIRRTEHSC